MSVRKRSWATGKGEKRESWIVDYADQSGERHIKTFDRKKDADAYHASVHVEVRRGTHTPISKSITVKEAADLWLQTCLEFERSTINVYRQHLDLHLLPLLGTKKLAQLTTPDVRAFADQLRASGRSQAMVKKVMIRLGSILADAQERGLVAQNVARGLRRTPRSKKERQADTRARGQLRAGVTNPTPDEIRAIIGALRGRWQRPLLLTAIFTGLRGSELRGLRWEDVDLKKGELHVRQRADCYNVIGEPKSAAGARTIPLPPILLNTLKQHRLASKHDL